MGDPKSIGSDVPNLMKDVQNCLGYTKFYEECTKGSKVSSEGIGPQSLPYGFQNEIMHHPCSDTGPESNRIGCTKFNERCTKGLKVHSKVGIDPHHGMHFRTFGTSFTKFGTSLIKFGASDLSASGTPISIWMVHNFI